MSIESAPMRKGNTGQEQIIGEYAIAYRLHEKAKLLPHTPLNIVAQLLCIDDKELYGKVSPEQVLEIWDKNKAVIRDSKAHEEEVDPHEKQ